MIDIVDMDEQIRRIGELADVTGRRMPFLFKTDAPAAQVVAAAGFARCRALLRGMFVLSQNSAGDVAGALLRSLYETWLCAIYVLEIGDPAIEELQLASHHERKLLAKDLDIDQFLDSSVPTHRLNVHSVKDKVKKSIEDAGGNADAVENGYRWLYRGESALNTHGGLDAISGYVEAWEGGLRVLSRRADADSPGFRLATAWALVLDLAAALWRDFGWNTIELDRIVSKTRGAVHEIPGPVA